MADDAPTQPDLAALYRAAVETGQAGELVRGLCAVHGVNLRGLAELTGISRDSFARWSRGANGASALALRSLQPLISPNQTTRKRIEDIASRHAYGATGRPRKR